MQIKNENNIFLSDDLKDIIDLDNITVSEDFLLCVNAFNKKLSVLSYKETSRKSILSIMIDEKDLLSLFSSHACHISLSLDEEVLRKYSLPKDLSSFKIEPGLKNIYKVKLVLKKEII